MFVHARYVKRWNKVLRKTEHFKGCNYQIQADGMPVGESDEHLYMLAI